MAYRARRIVKPPSYLLDFQSAGSLSAGPGNELPASSTEIHLVNPSPIEQVRTIQKPKRKNRGAPKKPVSKRPKQTDHLQKNLDIDLTGNPSDELPAAEPSESREEVRLSMTPVPSPEEVPVTKAPPPEVAKKTSKDIANERTVLQEPKFTLAKADLVDNQKFVVLRFQEHEASYVSPEQLGTGNPIVFHSGFAEYGSVFRVGDIVKGQFRNQNLYTAVIDAIVPNEEEAEEAARRCRTMQKLLTQEHGRNQSDPKQRSKNDRNQIGRVATLNSGSQRIPPAPAPSAVLEAARLNPASFTLFQTNDQGQSGSLTHFSGPSNRIFERISDSVQSERQPQMQSAGKKNSAKQVSKPPTATQKGNPIGTSKKATAAKKLEKDNDESPNVDGDGVGNWGFSQNSAASSADGDYVYPYTVKACRKIRLSRSYPVFVDERELYSVVSRSHSRRQLACSLTLHLLGGLRGVRHFYQNKPARHGISKVHKNLVLAVDEYVHSVRKVGGVPDLPRVRCIGQMLNSHLTHYYRNNTEQLQAE